MAKTTVWKQLHLKFYHKHIFSSMKILHNNVSHPSWANGEKRHLAFATRSHFHLHLIYGSVDDSTKRNLKWQEFIVDYVHILDPTFSTAGPHDCRPITISRIRLWHSYKVWTKSRNICVILGLTNTFKQ